MSRVRAVVDVPHPSEWIAVCHILCFYSAPGEKGDGQQSKSTHGGLLSKP